MSKATKHTYMHEKSMPSSTRESWKHYYCKKAKGKDRFLLICSKFNSLKKNIISI